MNRAWADRASRVTPGGLNTSARRLPKPLVFTSAAGQRISDAAGKTYVDFHLAFGCQILGHCDEYVDRRVAEAMRRCDVIGAGTTDLEILAAEKLVQHVESAEQVLFCLTGSESTHAALRLARTATGRRKILKFQGCYHGWHDAVLANVISGAGKIDTLDPLSAGMVPGSLDHTLIAEFNDVASVTAHFDRAGNDIAAVILEPMPHNVGCLLPTSEFLESVRALCTKHGTVLIFDEVVTGLRHGLHGFEAISGIKPDLVTWGKALGNGHPVAAVSGRADIMSQSSTAGGGAFFAGTFNSHAAGMAAFLATVERLEAPDVYEHLFMLGDRMRAGLKWAAEELDVATFSTGFGSLFVLYFLIGPVSGFRDLLANDADRFVAFQLGMIDKGFFVLPTNLKRSQVCAAHELADVDRAIAAAAEVLADVAVHDPVEVTT